MCASAKSGSFAMARASRAGFPAPLVEPRQMLLGAGVRRQQEIDSRHIIVDSLGRGRSDRKIEAVAQSIDDGPR